MALFSTENLAKNAVQAYLSYLVFCFRSVVGRMTAMPTSTSYGSSLCLSVAFQIKLFSVLRLHLILCLPENPNVVENDENSLALVPQKHFQQPPFVSFQVNLKYKIRSIGHVTHSKCWNWWEGLRERNVWKFFHKRQTLPEASYKSPSALVSWYLGMIPFLLFMWSLAS